MLRQHGRRTERVCELGRKLFYMAVIRDLPDWSPGWRDDPAAFIARLEETSEGASWLRDRWVEMRLPDDLRRALDVPRRVQAGPPAGQAPGRGDQRPGAERAVPGLGDHRGEVGRAVLGAHAAADVL